MRQLRKQRTNRADLSNPNGSVSYAASGRHVVACVVMIVRVWRECVSVLWCVSQVLQMSVLFVVICPMPLVCGGVENQCCSSAFRAIRARPPPPEAVGDRGPTRRAVAGRKAGRRRPN